MGRFQKGQSGNPGGRRKIAGSLRDLARALAPDALDTLKSVMTSAKAPHSVKVAAASAILDRGFGKPVQQIEAKVDFLDKLSDAEQRNLAAALAAVARDEEGASGGADSTYH